MKTKAILNFCLAQKGAYIDYPFGETPICVKVEKKLFAQIYPNKEDYKITLNCLPMTGDFYQRQYPGIVLPGYHCPAVQKPYFMTVLLNGTITDSVLKEMIKSSYKTVFAKLPKKMQKKIMEEI